MCPKIDVTGNLKIIRKIFGTKQTLKGQTSISLIDTEIDVLDSPAMTLIVPFRYSAWWDPA
jgi:hypothetical protein